MLDSQLMLKPPMIIPVREYAEGLDVELVEHDGRKCIRAKNEAGYNHVLLDLEDLIEFIATIRKC
jgi:hypothetical protein